MQRNPFLAGTIIEPEMFVGRQDELDVIKSWIEYHQSVFVIGEPHIGKSCLLYYLKNSEFSTWLPQDEEWLFVLRNGMDLGTSITPAKFWQSIFHEALKVWKDANLKKSLSTRIDEIDGSLENVKVILEKLRAKNKNLVLLIDELDGMVSNSKLAYYEFWGQIRHLADERTLCFIGTSRKTPYLLNTALNNAMENKIKPLADFGSPIFNVAHPLHMKQFSEDDIEELFTLVASKNIFTDLDDKVIRKLAGGHPYILQAIGEKFWSYRKPGKELDYQSIVESSLESLDDHFQDTWNYLKEIGNSCTLAALITLREIGQTTHDISILDNNIDMFYVESKALELAGVIKKRDGCIQLTSSLFAIWVQRNILVQPLEKLDDFLRSKEKKLGNITEEQLQRIIKIISQMYSETKSLITDFGISKNLLGLP